MDILSSENEEEDDTGGIEMPTDAEIEYMNEVMNDTLGDYYENEDGELQPIHDGFEARK